ncbi:hypothetical protein WJ978_13680 [Achromobacter xylosoxidans]
MLQQEGIAEARRQLHAQAVGSGRAAHLAVVHLAGVLGLDGARHLVQGLHPGVGARHRGVQGKGQRAEQQGGADTHRRDPAAAGRSWSCPIIAECR